MTTTTDRPTTTATLASTAAHLRPEPMAVAQRHLVAKALAEFAHERLLAPVRVDAGTTADDARGPHDYRVVLDGGRVVYRFRARRLALEHWALDESSLTRDVDGTPAPLDALDLVLELQPLLRIPDHLLAVYLEEIAATLASGAFKAHHGGPSAADLVGAPLWEVEAAMTEGHPSFVANNARIGFGVAEHAAFAPEAGRPVRLVWLAVRRSVSHLALGAGLDEDAFYRQELGGATVARFHAQLRDLGLDPADYRWLPVHPWQWEHRLAVTFAPDVARRDLVLLGAGDDDHLPQQSIRTLLNVSDPTRHYVKVALAIQNMGFLRGLSPAYMRATPAINDWVADLVASDPVLAGHRFRLLRERVSIGYTGDAYHRTPQPNAHRKMVAALWRESPVPLVPAGHRLATMASLLHRDADGASYVGALVAASGLDAATWVGRYLDVYLAPLVHCLLAHDLAFMPHGENVILELDAHVPVGAFLKDVGEEVVVLTDRPLPDEVARVRQPVDAAEAALAIFTDVFDGVLRHLAAILDTDGLIDERSFWALVAACVDAHAVRFPDLHRRVDLRAPRFAHSCLNRLQLRNTAQMVDLADQSGSLLFAGTLANPIARGLDA
ncbi:IucA/IucC family protein [Cellulomonas fimi]|uniref:IucA/IucC family protein n=1 Tax=Cellulomonas fimi (strain ATCC 484 / DSM 20113 / JCM 1341 / CCUG 24087 / LMG 16345 / NBRC 15513 / NCIMB 8980 / NCTC 7547 / NRS-133) TaxID=590998 RepID=F4GZ64_CELFA|nr:IucA/IucC family siderophore biosynthesis protein [Cellulomonas fimi]AEE47180.1 IucA/IucC family protein [Cellulomonas fimi ATCC 484]NNH09000.1 IucA/IucC family siderophore biosynthesis protein [Cellulomonas fimi]VEH35505.1 Aerobactin synthase IucC [Cellulomonas fimi]